MQVLRCIRMPSPRPPFYLSFPTQPVASFSSVWNSIFFNSIWAVPTLLIDFFFLSLSHHSSVANVCMFSFEIFACEISTRRVVECGEFYRWARRWRPTRRASSWGWATASWPCRHLLRLRADPARATWSEPGGRPLPISPPNCCRILLCTALGKSLPILHTNFGNNNQ